MMVVRATLRLTVLLFILNVSIQAEISNGVGGYRLGEIRYSDRRVQQGSNDKPPDFLDSDVETGIEFDDAVGIGARRLQTPIIVYPPGLAAYANQTFVTFSDSGDYNVTIYGNSVSNSASCPSLAASLLITNPMRAVPNTTQRMLRYKYRQLCGLCYGICCCYSRRRVQSL
jgi:hypothetical protein